MGWLDKIKRGYKNVDRKMGGWLPGGVPRSRPSTPTPKYRPTPRPQAPQSRRPNVFEQVLNRGKEQSIQPPTQQQAQQQTQQYNQNLQQWKNNRNINPQPNYTPNTDTQQQNIGENMVRWLEPQPSEETMQTGGQNSPFQNDFFSMEGQQERINAAGQTIKEAVTGNGQAIISNTGVGFVDKILNTVANHPFQTALVGTGIWEAGKSISGVSSLGEKIISGEPILEGEIAEVSAGQIPSRSALYSYSQVDPMILKARNFQKYLTRLVRKLKSPTMVAGIIGSLAYTSLFWAPNEKNDALTSLTILQNQAIKDKDFDSVMEINDLIEETGQIWAQLPIVGFMQSEKAKYKATMLASKINTAKALKMVEDSKKQKEDSMTQMQDTANFWDEYNNRQAENRKKETESQAEFYRKIAEEKRKAQIENRNEDAAFWDKINKEKRKYWEEQQRLKQMSEEEKRRYWESNKKSALNFGIL